MRSSASRTSSACGRRRDRDAPRRARSGGRLARACGEAQGAVRCAQRPRLRRDRFRGPGTDLTVGLLPASRWMCATFTTETGIEHIPNLPTEEVFTSPDWRRTQGTVRSTYPLLVPGVGVLVEGLELRFDDGKVVDVRAAEGGAAVEAQLESDEQARFSARSLSSTATPPSSARGSSSRTRCSTRTRRATSPTARGCRWRSTASTASRPRSCSSWASTSRASTRTS